MHVRILLVCPSLFMCIYVCADTTNGCTYICLCTHLSLHVCVVSCLCVCARALAHPVGRQGQRTRTRTRTPMEEDHSLDACSDVEVGEVLRHALGGGLRQLERERVRVSKAAGRAEAQVRREVREHQGEYLAQVQQVHVVEKRLDAVASSVAGLGTLVERCVGGGWGVGCGASCLLCGGQLQRTDRG